MPRKANVKRAPAAALDPAEFAAWGGFLAAHSRLAARLDAELRHDHGMTLAAYDVLVNLRHAPSQRMRMAALAETVHFSLGGMTKLVRRLEQDGLVRREPDPTDGRAWFAVLTTDGDARLARARASHLAAVRRLFLDHATPAELELLGALWRRVLDAAEPAPPRDREE